MTVNKIESYSTCHECGKPLYDDDETKEESGTAITGWGGIGKRVLRALGIDPSQRVVNIDIKIHLSEIVTVTIERLVDSNEMAGVLHVIEQYELHKKD